MSGSRGAIGLAQFDDFHDVLDPSGTAFRQDVIAGLSARPRTLPCKYFYDARGSALFEQICTLDEYYPTRTETALLRDHARAMAETIGAGATLVEFGSGASVKVRLLLDALAEPRAYVPVDISREHMIEATAPLAGDYPDLAVVPVCADYTKPFELPALDEGPRVGFFPGSTIGNFTPDEAVEFLASAARSLGPTSRFLIGVDLEKDPAILNAAYNDAKGVTAAFNLNLLHRIENELGAEIDLAGFAHHAWYNAAAARIEMHLVSKRRQSVTIGDHRFDFAPGETIHTESSHKYSVERFRQVAERAGWTISATWIDDDALFSVHAMRQRATA